MELDKSTKQLVLFMYCSNLKYLTFHDQLLPACSLHLQFTTCSEVMLYAFALKVDVNPTGTTSAVPLGHAEIALSFFPAFHLVISVESQGARTPRRDFSITQGIGPSIIDDQGPEQVKGRCCNVASWNPMMDLGPRTQSNIEYTYRRCIQNDYACSWWCVCT